VGFLDEFAEMGKAPFDTLSAGQLASIEAAFRRAAGGGVSIAGVTARVMYAPVDGSTAPVPAIPAAQTSTTRRLSRRRLLQSSGTGGLTVVTRITVPAASLADASQNLGAAFGSGELLTALRAALGSQYLESTFRSTASRQAWRDSSGETKGAVASGRISSQLVAADQDPCNAANGGCHGLVSCTADPSNDATGVLCGQCPAGYAGDAVVAGTGCVDIDECKDETVVNGGCSPLVVCSNTVGGRTCGGCPGGYTGSGVTCVDVNECAAANGGCDSLTACTNTVGARTCGGCPPGYKVGRCSLTLSKPELKARLVSALETKM